MSLNSLKQHLLIVRSNDGRSKATPELMRSENAVDKCIEFLQNIESQTSDTVERIDQLKMKRKDQK
jgi:hypothetical protein